MVEDPLAREKRLAKNRAAQQRYRQRHPERIKAYKQKNRDSIREKDRLYRLDNLTKERQRSQRYYQAHLEERRIYRQTRRAIMHVYNMIYHTQNRERNNKYSRQYYHEHQETLREYARIYDSLHKDKKRAYLRAHPELVKLHNQTRRARRKGAPINDLTIAQWRAIKAHYGHQCVYCGIHSQRLTQDHIVPLSKGGSHTVWNVVPACQSCNSRKHDGPPLCPVQPLLLAVGDD